MKIKKQKKLLLKSILLVFFLIPVILSVVSVVGCNNQEQEHLNETIRSKLKTFDKKNKSNNTTREELKNILEPEKEEDSNSTIYVPEVESVSSNFNDNQTKNTTDSNTWDSIVDHTTKAVKTIDNINKGVGGLTSVINTLNTLNQKNKAINRKPTKKNQQKIKAINRKPTKKNQQKIKAINRKPTKKNQQKIKAINRKPTKKNQQKIKAINPQIKKNKQQKNIRSRINKKLQQKKVNRINKLGRKR